MRASKWPESATVRMQLICVFFRCIILDWHAFFRANDPLCNTMLKYALSRSASNTHYTACSVTLSDNHAVLILSVNKIRSGSTLFKKINKVGTNAKTKRKFSFTFLLPSHFFFFKYQNALTS